MPTNESISHENEIIYIRNNWTNSAQTAGTFYYYLKGSGFSTLSMDMNSLTLPTAGSITLTIEASKDPDNTADGANYTDITNDYFGVASWTAAATGVINTAMLDYRYVRLKIVTTDPGVNNDGAWDIDIIQTNLPLGGGGGGGGVSATYNAILPVLGDGDPSDLQVNSNGQLEIGGYNRIDNVLETTVQNQHSVAVSSYYSMYVAETGNVDSPTIPNRMFYKHWNIMIKCVVAGGAGAGTVEVKVKTQNIDVWATYASYSIPVAAGTYAHMITIAEPIDEIKMTISGIANATIDSEAFGRGA